jgi:predicted dehydrogenase
MEKLDRRNFLKAGLVGGSSLLFAPWFSQAVNAKQAGKSASDKVRIGVIGPGSRGRYLMKQLIHIKEEQNVEIVALCDNYEPSLKAASKLVNGKATTYTDYKVMLDKEKDLDAVVIATPLHEHSRITVDALNAGLHVFCEKAMARTLPQIKAMADAYKASGKALQIGHQRMFDPIYLNAFDMVKRGEIGDIQQVRAYWHRYSDWRRKVPKGKEKELERKINWRLYKEYSCGLMTELASHQIQVANWFTGKTPVSVRGTGGIRYWKDGREVEDNVALIFSYDDGTQFIYDSMTSNRHYGLEEQILGNKATLELETNKFIREKAPTAPGFLRLINDIEHDIFDNIRIGNASWIPETAVKYDGEEILPKEQDKDENTLQMISFVDSIRNNNFKHELFEQGYWASIWTLLGFDAIETGEVRTLPEGYLI